MVRILLLKPLESLPTFPRPRTTDFPLLTLDLRQSVGNAKKTAAPILRSGVAI